MNFPECSCAEMEPARIGRQRRHSHRISVTRLADGVTKSFPVASQNMKPGSGRAYLNLLAQIRRWLRESPPG